MSRKRRDANRPDKPGKLARMEGTLVDLTITEGKGPLLQRVVQKIEKEVAKRDPEEQCRVVCSVFPRGSMAALIEQVPSIVSFRCSYGPIFAAQLSNPDLKLLVKTMGKQLAELVLSPTPDARPLKLQGCGYRWVAKHATCLRRLEITLGMDRKRQLIPRLNTQFLETLVLHDVGDHVSRETLRALVQRSPNLSSLTLIGCEWAPAGCPATDLGISDSVAVRFLDLQAK
mmetsp:Transcript_28683/g.67797  ORF Transcript_28683/g.67797 Transcript_28683/m.67797 type:complete len:229 (-) Transcript_28683:179-865(-)